MSRLTKQLSTIVAAVAVLTLGGTSSASAAAPPPGTSPCGSALAQGFGQYSVRTGGAVVIRITNPGPGTISGRVVSNYQPDVTENWVVSIRPGASEEHPFGNLNTPYGRRFYLTTDFAGFRGTTPTYGVDAFSSTCRVALY